MSEITLVASIYGLVAGIAIAGYLFLRRVVADGDFSVFRKTANVLVAPFHIMRVAAVFILVVVGVAFLLMSPYYVTYPVTTGYRYELVPVYGTLRYTDAVCSATGGYTAGSTAVVVGNACNFYERFTLGKALVNVQLLETPVRTYITQLFFRPDFVLVGLAFLIAGLILTAYFLAKANNLLYDETNKYKTYTIASELAVTASFLEKTKNFLHNQ
jgi:hypothetical protein